MIPAMTHPLGAMWRQPVDIREAPIDEETVLLTRHQFDGLPSYDASLPTGVYEGKCWKCARYDGPPLAGGRIVGFDLVWYGDAGPDACSTERRRIEVVS